ncbi:GNAT family N-acetyltransferase [Pseudomonas sp. NPDC090202]|uniref:GNAT family N-acetyltransferase n=1 Tax=unclassified Pseudomonas TaxID=196821 RepID=UPI0038196BFD
MSLQVRDALQEDCQFISEIAARTFALACPANTPVEEIERYIQSHLLPAHFKALVEDDRKELRVVLKEADVIGYSLIDLAPKGLGIAAADHARELTRCYVSAAEHGTGAAQLLMDRSLEQQTGPVRLTVNETNDRAIRFYQRNGFEIVGETTFVCGEDLHRDWVMVRKA